MDDWSCWDSFTNACAGFVIGCILFAIIYTPKTEREWNKLADKPVCSVIKAKVNGHNTSGFKCGTAYYFNPDKGGVGAIKIDNL